MSTSSKPFPNSTLDKHHNQYVMRNDVVHLNGWLIDWVFKHIQNACLMQQCAWMRNRLLTCDVIGFRYKQNV